MYEWLEIYELTGIERLRTALKGTQLKGPVVARTDEFWTFPFFNTYRWNLRNGFMSQA
jgi:hypothetical protein